MEACNLLQLPTYQLENVDGALLDFYIEGDMVVQVER
jgi:hypothetical protein